jgi:hypothetical protein
LYGTFVSNSRFYSLNENHIIILFSTANRTNHTYFLQTLGMRTSVLSLQQMIYIC